MSRRPFPTVIGVMPATVGSVAIIWLVAVSITERVPSKLLTCGRVPSGLIATPWAGAATAIGLVPAVVGSVSIRVLVAGSMTATVALAVATYSRVPSGLNTSALAPGMAMAVAVSVKGALSISRR